MGKPQERFTQEFTANVDFRKCAAETVSVARDLYPDDPSIAANVAQAWTDVGVEIGPAAAAG